MTRYLIDINDTGLLGSLVPGGELQDLGAGYALREGNALFLGEAARARSRSHPRALRSRFWQQFGDASDASRDRDSLKNSDLVHQQLSQIWERFHLRARAVTMAVPSFFSQQQLGLLRGMTQALGMPLNCMVDSALAAALPVLAANPHGHLKAGQRILFVDLHLHRVTWTELRCRVVEETDTPWLVKETSGHVGKLGLVRLTNLWARFLAGAFVKTTRFDPFFNGATEQALYDCIPSCLRDMEKWGKATVSLDGLGSQLNLETTAAEWATAVAPLYQQILDSIKQALQRCQPVLLLLSHRIAHLPALAVSMASNFAGTTLSLPRDGILKGVQTMADPGHTTGDSFHLVIQHPLSKNNPKSTCEAKLVPTQSAVQQPTHVLMDATAYALNQQKFTLTNQEPTNGVGISLPKGRSHFHFEFHKGAKGLVLKVIAGGCRVNGEEVGETTSLAVGDRISVDGTQIDLLLILEAT